MNVRELLERVRLNNPKLSRLSGVPLGYLEQLSAGNQGAGPATMKKLADGIRVHAKAMQVAADTLDPPGGRIPTGTES